MQQALVTTSIIGSLVLVAVTTWYAWQTQQMVREMRAARAASVRPAIRLDLGLVGGTAYVEVENVGAGPALNIEADLTVSTDEGEVEHHHWTRALLRISESQTMLVPNDFKLLSELKDLGATVAINGTCQDLDDREHPISDTLSFVTLGDRSPEGEWTGVEDRVPKNVEAIAKELKEIRSYLTSVKNPWRGV
jgi:hypothetical protein